MKTIRILTTILTSIILIILLTNTVFAIYPGDISADHSIDGAPSVRKLGGEIIGMVQVVGSVVAIGVLVVLGIKYMLGTIEEKAEYKKTLMPYIIGAVLTFGAANIASVIYDAVSGISI